jgi:hypothetical protein
VGCEMCASRNGGKTQRYLFIPHAVRRCSGLVDITR